MKSSGSDVEYDSELLSWTSEMPKNPLKSKEIPMERTDNLRDGLGSQKSHLNENKQGQHL